MVEISQLWLPVVVSSVVVFFASFLAWMVIGHHKNDIKTLEEEQSLVDHLKTLNIPPGTYMWPGCGSHEDMNSPEFKARYNAGPWGSINVLGAKPNFARNLALTFLFYVVVSLFVAYITGQARAVGAERMTVFQVAGAVAVLAYCAGSIPGAIFFSKPGRFILTEFVDGVVYGLLTGVVFSLAWPGA